MGWWTVPFVLVLEIVEDDETALEQVQPEVRRALVADAPVARLRHIEDRIVEDAIVLERQDVGRFIVDAHPRQRVERIGDVEISRRVIVRPARAAEQRPAVADAREDEAAVVGRVADSPLLAVRSSVNGLGGGE